MRPRWRHGPASITLVRHGESVGNLADTRAQEAEAEVLDLDDRDADVALSPRGREQAGALGTWLASEAGRDAVPDVVVSSPYRRAGETAERALSRTGLAVTYDERLRERDLGLVDGLTGRGIRARYPDEAERRGRLGKFYYQPPSGESWADVVLRIRSLMLDLERLDGYVQTFGLDALRYFLAGQGPLGAGDRDFAEARFVEVYNADLANNVGNLVQRATTLIGRNAGGQLPEPGEIGEAERTLRAEAEALPGRVAEALDRLALDEALAAVTGLVGAANKYAEETAPWQLAKTGDPRLATSLYHLAEAARLAAWYLTPVMPTVAAEAHQRLCGREPEAGLGAFGAVAPGAPVSGGAPLFPRVQAPAVAG